jgi:hypothetical protein
LAATASVGRASTTRSTPQQNGWHGLNRRKRKTPTAKLAGETAMMLGEGDGLVARIRQVRRLSTARDQPRSDARESQPDRVQALEARVAHLEQLLEGLKDAVRRDRSGASGSSPR